MSNGTQVVVSAVNPAELASKLKDATQVVQVPTGALSTIDWASKLKVSLGLQVNFLHFVEVMSSEVLHL